MSKSSTATARPPPQNTGINSRSAWAKGPPAINTSAANPSASSTTSSATGTPRSQSPTPSSVQTSQHGTPTHSRKPSALGSAPVAMAIGTNVPRVGGKTHSPVTFGSIDQPTSPPPAASNNGSSAAPSGADANPSISTKVKTFGSIASATPTGSTPSPSPVNGTATPSTAATSTPSSAAASPQPTTSKPRAVKFDVKKLFQGGGMPAQSNPLPSNNVPPPSTNMNFPTSFSQGHPPNHQPHPSLPHQSPRKGPSSIPPALHQRPPQGGSNNYSGPYSPATQNRQLSHQSVPPPLTSQSSNSSTGAPQVNPGSMPRSPSFNQHRPPHGLGVNGLVRPPLPGQQSSGGTPPGPASTNSPAHSNATLNGTGSPMPQSPRVLAQLPGTPGPGPPPGPGGMQQPANGMMMSGMQPGMQPMMMWGGYGYVNYPQYPQSGQPFMAPDQYGSMHPPQWLPPHMLHHQQPQHPPSHPQTPQHQHQHLHSGGPQSHSPSPHLAPATPHSHPTMPPPPQNSVASPRPNLPPLTSPGPYPASPSINNAPAPTPGPNRHSMSAGASTFVPSKRMSAIMIKDPNTGNAIVPTAPTAGLGHKREPSVGPVTPRSGAATPERNTSSPAQPALVKKTSVAVRLESADEREKRLAAEKEKADKEEEERLKKEEEEKERLRKEEEEKERLRKEEEERIKKEEEEERERIRQEEEERIRKEKEAEEEKERERIRLEEEEKEKERQRVAAEEREKERLRKIAEEEEAAKEKERLRLQEEKEKEAKDKEEQAKKEEEERAAVEKAAAEPSSPSESQDATGPLPSTSGHPFTPQPPFTPPTPSTANSISKKRPIPGPLDLSSANRPGLPPPLPSALATARIISSLNEVSYPSGIASPKAELNQGAKDGKFRYDRDFLMQFMEVCREKPDNLPPLEAIGLASDETGPHPMGGRSGSGRRTSSNAGLGFNNAQPARANIGLGIPMGPGGIQKGQSFGFGVGAVGRGGTAPGNVPFPGAKPGLVRTASQGGPGQNAPNQPSSLGRNRERGSRRGTNRAEGGRAASHAAPPNLPPQGFPNLEPVAPLEASANRWTAGSLASTSKRGGTTSVQPDVESSEVLDKKVKALLNKLTMERFDSISDQIIEWANRSEREKDGRTLMRVIRHVFEKATDEATWSEMYAKLCRKMLEKISNDVVDESIKTTEGKPFSGGQLFRKYLLNRCQEDFERGWQAKEAAGAAAAAKAQGDSEQAAKEEQGEEALYSDEYYASQKAKRQGLGLVKFIGELFKLQMLTERIMHQCIKKLLTNLENPAEEEIESLCKLLATVGQQLDSPKAKNHMDIYFVRMKELSQNPKIASRMQYMLLDVIELRSRGWLSRTAVQAPTTIAAVHEQAAKDKLAAEKEAFAGRVPMSRGGSRRGDSSRSDFGQSNPDGWTTAGNVVAPRPLAKAGDLSKFGQIGKSTPATYGPSAAFKRQENAIKRESGSLSRTASNSNMFASLGGSEMPEGPVQARTSQPPSRKPSADFSQGGLEGLPTTRRPIKLLPRSVPQELKDATGEGSTGDNTPDIVSEDDEDGLEEGEIRDLDMTDSQELPAMSEADAKKKIEEDLKELFSIRNLDEAEEYFRTLPSAHHSTLVDKIVTKVLDMKEADAQFVAAYFGRVVDKDLISSTDMEQGFPGSLEFLDDVAVDVPAAYKLMAIMMHGAKLSSEAVDRLADKIAVDGDPMVTPKQKLMKEIDKLAS